MLNRGKTGPRRSATIGDRRGGFSHRVVERRRQSRRVAVEANRRCEIGITRYSSHELSFAQYAFNIRFMGLQLVQFVKTEICIHI